MLYGLGNARRALHAPARTDSAAQRSHASAPGRRGIPVGGKIPNWHLVNDRHTQVPLYMELPSEYNPRPAVIVMNPIQPKPQEWRRSEQQDWYKRLQGYGKSSAEFQKAGVSVLFICPQTVTYNMPLVVKEMIRPGFPVYSLTRRSMEDLLASGYAFQKQGDEFFGEPSTIIVTEDKTVAGFSDSKTVKPEDEAMSTLEYMMKTKLVLSSEAKTFERKFGM